MNEAEGTEAQAVSSDAETGSHTVLVVDSSGSMRKGDVPGYPSRTAAVYDCLARDFVEPQLQADTSTNKSKGGIAKSTHVVTLIEMSDRASIVFARHPFDEELKAKLKKRAGSRARSHGNYLPALDAVIDLLRRDAAHGKQLFLLFLSDGAPSDHVAMPCDHGVMVWQEGEGLGLYKGKPALAKCPGGMQCRAKVKQQLMKACLDRITTLGDLFGRDRTYVGTVAFGPPDEDYAVLRQMAGVLPRGSFQKLGLTALHLRTALSSLTSSLTSLRSDAGASAGLTERAVHMQRDGARGTDGWDVYRLSAGAALSKERFDVTARRFVPAAYEAGSDGVAHSRSAFAQGAERLVFHFTEIDAQGRMLGPRLVAKQTRFKELMLAQDFHTVFCRVQGEAQALAALFNRRAAGPPAWAVGFVEGAVYHVRDARYPGGSVRVLVEPELEGRYTKWNNNAGAVRTAAGSAAARARGRELAALTEEDGEEEEEERGIDAGDEASTSDVPQCFSHFTHEASLGEKLVCDLQVVLTRVRAPGALKRREDRTRKRGNNLSLRRIGPGASPFDPDPRPARRSLFMTHIRLGRRAQGVWNDDDGYVLTDPVIHTGAGQRRQGGPGRVRRAANGKTDKGEEGIRLFFSTHVCNALCRRLGLRPVRLPAF